MIGFRRALLGLVAAGPGMGKKWFIALTSALSAIILATFVAVPAQASTGTVLATSVPTVNSASASLRIDCSTITAAGRKYAVTHHVNICGILSAKSTGAITPYSDPDTVTDDCGSATVGLYSLGSGNANIYWYLHSTSGWIFSYEVVVHYAGTARSGTVGFSGYPLDQIDASSYTDQHTGEGWADAYLTGFVQTILYDCYVENPYAGTYI